MYAKLHRFVKNYMLNNENNQMYLFKSNFSNVIESLYSIAQYVVLKLCMLYNRTHFFLDLT